MGKNKTIVNVKKKDGIRKGMSATRTIVVGFLVIILAGALLLNLPAASQSGKSIGFVNALFTATSATCVTGLIVAPTLTQWTLFGHIVILALIQVGGLGFVTLVTLAFVIAGKKITIKERLLLQESLNRDVYGQVGSIIKRIVLGTFIVEGITAVLLTIRFAFEYSIGKSIWLGVFHAISAFCNAGFDILSESSLIPYADDVYINVVLMIVIIVGGLGFTVWFDMIDVFKKSRANGFSLRFWFKNLSLHSKIVLTVTPALILGGAVLYFILEYSNPGTMGDMSFGEKMLASIFQSVTVRTAGFNSIDQGQMTYGSKFVTVILMMIGGSPGSTAGGIKTVTVGILAAALISVIRGRKNTVIYGRRISFYTHQKALAVTMLGMIVMCTVTVMLTLTESQMAVDHEFIDIMYEVASAAGTVGITTGITPYLSEIGKMIIAVTMFFGRIGPITIALSLAKRQAKNMDVVEYPTEEVMVG